MSLLTEISGYLPPTLREAALQIALAATKLIQHGPDRLDALKRLAPALPPYLFPEALAIGSAMPSEIARVEALQALAPELSPELL